MSSSSPRTPRQSKSEPQDFSCPLVDCGRKCDSKKLLMLHLAITHYQQEMEERYIAGLSLKVLIHKSKKYLIVYHFLSFIKFWILFTLKWLNLG